MRTHRRIHRRRYAVAILASLAAAAGGPAAALADSTAQPAPRIGDTPAEFGQPVASAPTAGDTPADFPGVSRAQQSTAPSTITVVRPERTIVQDSNPALPLILASLALLVALGVAGTALAQMRSPRVGGAH
jgi:hypothetical protein